VRTPAPTDTAVTPAEQPPDRTDHAGHLLPSLDQVAADPTLAARLPAQVRSCLLARCAAVLGKPVGNRANPGTASRRTHGPELRHADAAGGADRVREEYSPHVGGAALPHSR